MTDFEGFLIQHRATLRYAATPPNGAVYRTVPHPQDVPDAMRFATHAQAESVRAAFTPFHDTFTVVPAHEVTQ